MSELAAEGLTLAGDTPGPQALPPALLPVVGGSYPAKPGRAGLSGERTVRGAHGSPRVRAPAPRGRGTRRLRAHADRTAWAIMFENRGWSVFGKIRGKNGRLRRALTRHSTTGSMGRVASLGDNAAMESFFALLQKNVLDRRAWTTREELGIAIITWTERTYHRRRRQARLGRLTPIEFEAIMRPNVTLRT